jgi:hypothetical protein
VTNGLPETIPPPSAALANVAEPPKRTPRLRLKSSFTIAMRASISTWRIGMSSVVTSRRMSCSRSEVSWINSVLVRSSIVTLPRFDRIEFSPEDLSSPARSAALA